MKLKAAHIVTMPARGVRDHPAGIDALDSRTSAQAGNYHSTDFRRELGAASNDVSPQRVIRIKEVMEITGLRRAKLYALQAEGLFPMRIQLTNHSVGWLAADVQKWISGRVANSKPLRTTTRPDPH